MNTPAFTVTVIADSIKELQDRMRDMLPREPLKDFIKEMDFEKLLLRVAERVEEEGHEMEVWKKGERPVPDLDPAEKRKVEARAKLRGELVASLAEATHATSVVKEEIEAIHPTEAGEPPETETKPKRSHKAKKPNGGAAAAGETPEALKARMILRLQELYGEGRKADVNKLLAAHGNGAKTFSAIPAEQFAEIAEAVEAL